MELHVNEELVRRQQDNEEMIIDRGIGLYRVALVDAKNNGCMADTMPGRWLSSMLLEPVSMKIRARLNEAMEGKAGPAAKDAQILSQLEPDVLAYVTLRTIMNSILEAKGGCARSAIEYRLAREVREEIQHNHMAKEKSSTYQYWTREAQRIPDVRTKQRCMDRLRKNFPDLPTFRNEDERKALRSACTILIFAAVEATGIATIERQCKSGQKKWDRPDVLILNPAFCDKLDKMSHKAESLWPKFEPMLCPPRPWTGAFKGGFIGKLGERTKLVRTDNRDYLEDIHNKIQQGGMTKVLAALNAVQATPWRVNRRIYEAMKQAFEDGGKGYGLPEKEPLAHPDVPADIKTNKKAAKDWVDKLKAVQRLEGQRISKFRAVHNMLRTATMYVDEDALWFAHNLDWRGRIYPMASYLSPQGEEYARALLEFAQGLPLETDEAVEWLAIHGAGCYGVDKVPFAERIQWVRDHETEIRQAAGNPLGCCEFWTEADKPWMFLAFCFDWAGYLEEGKSYISRLPVAMDGSCNGLQNFAAMLRHEETAIAVNLAPSEKPNDIYQKVADKLKPRIKALAESASWTTEEILPELEERNRLEYADKDRVSQEKEAVRKRLKKEEITKEEARKLSKAIVRTISTEERQKTSDMWDVVAARWIREHIDRKLVKRPVMTYPYAVTLYGIRDQLISTLLDMHGAGKTDYPIQHVGKVAQMLRAYVFEAIQETVVAAAKAMEWLQEAAKAVAEGNLPVKWTSPVGMEVVQAYRQSSTERTFAVIGGRRICSRKHSENENLISKTRQASGVAPNFVHSCDGSHLMFTVLACESMGIQDFHMIHDSYGTHARNAASLAKALREEFVKMYGERDVLQDFHEQLKIQLHDRPTLAERIPAPPAQENFDLTQVLKSKYFFA